MQTRLAAVKGASLDGQSASLVTQVQSMFDELYSKPLDEKNYVQAAEHGRLRARAGLILIAQQPKEKLTEFVELISEMLDSFRYH